MSFNTRSFGATGENAAADFLAEKGYEIIARNFRYSRYSEIDLIAMKGDAVLFVEVKTRQSDSFGGPLYSLNPRKIRNLKKCAQFFLLKNPEFYSNFNFRFDLIYIQNGKAQWLENIIPF